MNAITYKDIHQDYIKRSISTHGGKMSDIPSISTSCLCNPFCKARRAAADDNSICARCYAHNYLTFRATLREKLERNTAFYTNADIQPEDVPRLNYSVFRFESFGELVNVQQLKNYVTIANKNPNTVFTLWTKRLDIVKNAIEHGLQTYDNFNIIASSRNINKSDMEYYLNKYGNIFDACFTVYSPEHIRENNIQIDCIGDCINCLKCYSRDLDAAAPIEINEKLK